MLRPTTDDVAWIEYAHPSKIPLYVQPLLAVLGLICILERCKKPNQLLWMDKFS